MKIVSTEEVEFATASRTGYAAALTSSLKQMEPGQTLLVDVNFSEVADLDEEGLDAFVARYQIKSKAGESRTGAISRWLANRQRTRIMASLNTSKLPEHYYHTRLVAPEDGDVFQTIAIICDPIENKPKRAKRKTKG